MCTHTYPNGKPAIEIHDHPETSSPGDFKTICKHEVSQVMFEEY